MTTIKFSDGTKLDTVRVFSSQQYFQGATRSALEIQIAPTATTFDALDKLATEANTGKLILTDESGAEFAHDGYVMRKELSLRQVEVTPATSTAAAVTENRLVLVLCQRTYMETQQASMQSQIDALTLSALGVTE